jgi:UDP-N-acetylglucosamine--N-acetylmuramyl-(pentapeptide) pyrophosphoryl-undecaprenol N-acetylglucosamine transferase
MKIIIAGGGTGGHIFPALAIANALQSKSPGVEILFVGAKGKMEMEKIPAAGFEIKGIDIAGYNRSSLLRNLSLPIKLIQSFFEVRKILRDFKPDAVVGVGGYSSFPVLQYAQMRKIKTFIHESNSLAGRSNLILGKKATAIFVAHPGMEKYFPSEKIIVTGNPIRKVLLKEIPKAEALEFFGLKAGIKTVFVMGGSLGARSINETIEENIDVFKKNNLQLIWQTGKTFAPSAARAEEERMNIWTNAFIDKVENAYAAADVVVSRSGGMAVSEMCVVARPAIFVPFPFAAEDHQTINAKRLADLDAALMIPDAEAKTKLIPEILKLINDEQKMEELKNNISKMRKTDADEMIASEILNSIK